MSLSPGDPTQRVRPRRLLYLTGTEFPFKVSPIRTPGGPVPATLRGSMIKAMRSNSLASLAIVQTLTFSAGRTNLHHDGLSIYGQNVDLGRSLKMRIRLPQLVFICALVCCTATASAQQHSWAQPLFSKLDHDFGVVARGADVMYRLKLVNRFPHSIHIVGVRTTCGCVSGSLSKDTLASGEEGYVQVNLDTRRFMRDRNANVIVTFDQPAYEEVTIPIKAYIRTDVVLEPGSAAFHDVPLGAAQERHIELSYAGRSNWSIRKIVGGNDYIAARFDETSRGQGFVKYNITVELKSNAPVGDIREQLRILTDDQNSPEIPVLVEARIVPEITVTEVVAVGILAPGETRTVNVVLRGRKPFMIEKIESETGSDAYKVRLPTKPSIVHVLPLIVTAPSQPGSLGEEFTVTVSGASQPLHFRTTGKVIPTGAPATLP